MIRGWTDAADVFMDLCMYNEIISCGELNEVNAPKMQSVYPKLCGMYVHYEIKCNKQSLK